MIVVSNASPVVNLAAVNQLELLRRLYQRVLIPEAVFRELRASGLPQFRGGGEAEISWLAPRTVANRALVSSLLLELDGGEAEAIALATEAGADLLLIDERRGRRIAGSLGLRVLGLLGVLLEAKGKGLINSVRQVLDELIAKAGFWIGQELYERVLREAEE